jgi:hypothetical protein
MPEISLDAQLRFAINSKRLIQFRYHDALRVAEPHDYGVQKGVTRVLAFQLRGASSRTTSARGWKLLDVTKISGCIVLDETFAGSRGEAHQQHYVWDVLYARVGDSSATSEESDGTLSPQFGPKARRPAGSG